MTAHPHRDSADPSRRQAIELAQAAVLKLVAEAIRTGGPARTLAAIDYGGSPADVLVLLERIIRADGTWNPRP